jgi:CDP-diacylglycerol--glycerol-3-phosphate 3-phosphatidyltransferase
MRLPGQWWKNLYEAREKDRYVVVSSKIGHSLDPFILKIYHIIFRNKHIHPNMLTVFGTCFGFASSACIIFEYFLFGALALLLSGFLDIFDGALARGSGKVTIFGGFLDSVLDRYTDLFVMGGIFFFYITHGSVRYAAITFIATVGTAIIPYARARAEAVAVKCRSGLLERPERIVLLLIGLFIPVLLSSVMIILAVFTHITVIQRIIYVRRSIKN